MPFLLTKSGLRLFVFVLAAALVLPDAAAQRKRAAKTTDAAPRVRQYFIAAEDVVWDYAPLGRNRMHGTPIPDEWSDSRRPKKRYIEYTDATFKTRKPQPEWLGILGPILRAEVGDILEVEFLNRARGPHSIHVHGLRYDKQNEGAHYAPFLGGKGAAVPTGERFRYRWTVSEGSGPASDEGPARLWLYHGHVNPSEEINSGLIGPIIVTARDKANPDGSPRGIDREFVTLLMVFDEMSGSESGLFHAVNGYIFGNLQGLKMPINSKVLWHVAALGNELDLHTAHWHGHTGKYLGRNRDVIELLPASTGSLEFVADNPGSWMFECHVSDHRDGGMMTIYEVGEIAAPACAVEIQEGVFWKEQQATFKVVNNTDKLIRRVSLEPKVITLEPRVLQRVWLDWVVEEPIEPRGQREARFARSVAGAEQIPAWVMQATRVEFADGSTWSPPSEEACITVFYRDGKVETSLPRQ